MSRQASLREIESQVGVVVRRVKRAVAERARLVHPDLHPFGYMTLAHLVEHGPMRATCLAEQIGVDKGALSRQVQHLVELGLVERQPDPDDGRAALLVVTDETRSRSAAVSRARQARFDRRLEGWTDARLAEFARALADYNTVLGQDDPRLQEQAVAVR